MNNSELISIIVPVYNVENYIDKCLDSLLGQVFRNLEVICVNDGSTDHSGDICEQYKERDSRVKVFHIENSGVSNARNFGLTKIQGQWFAFIDADDWIEPDCLSVLLENALKYDCDISACSYQLNTKYCMGYDKEKVETFLFASTEECIHSFICEGNSLQGQSTNKLYRTALFGDICFDSRHKVNEDCLYTYEIMSRCSRACLSNAPLYHWLKREDSACHSRKINCDFKPANVFIELLEKTNCFENREINITLKKNYIESVIRILLFGDVDKKDIEVKKAKKQCALWKKDAWSLMDNKMRIKYAIALHFPWVGKLIQ